MLGICLHDIGMSNGVLLRVKVHGGRLHIFVMKA